MKLLYCIFAVFFFTTANAELVVDDISGYPPGQSKEFTSIWSNDFEVCVKAQNSDTDFRQEQCSKHGCLKITNKENGATKQSHGRTLVKKYSGIDTLSFSVSHEYENIENLRVSVFNPKYILDEVFTLQPGEIKEYSVESDTPLFIGAGIQVENLNSLYEACAKTKDGRSCLRMEYPGIFESWSWTTTTSGIHKTLKPSKNGQIKFRVINNYPINIDLRVTTGDPKPDTCYGP
jgi:hypothetical protein